MTDKEAKVDKAVALVRTKTHSSNILEEEKQSEVEWGNEVSWMERQNVERLFVVERLNVDDRM